MQKNFQRSKAIRLEGREGFSECEIAISEPVQQLVWEVHALLRDIPYVLENSFTSGLVVMWAYSNSKLRLLTSNSTATHRLSAAQFFFSHVLPRTSIVVNKGGRGEERSL